MDSNQMPGQPGGPVDPNAPMGGGTQTPPSVPQQDPVEPVNPDPVPATPQGGEPQPNPMGDGGMGGGTDTGMGGGQPPVGGTPV